MKSLEKTPAAGQELAVTVKIFERLIKRRTDGRNLGVFLRRQIVEVLVGRFARMDLVLDAVETGHQQSGEGEVGIGRRIREANLNAAGLRAVDVRNADGSRTVAGRVGELHGCFKAGHETTIRIDRRIRDGLEGAGVLDDAADVVERKLGETGVTVAAKRFWPSFQMD